jgi:hypothetical protein
MRNRNLISMIYANLEKTSAAAEKVTQTNARPATLSVAVVASQEDIPAPLIGINKAKMS